MTDNTELKRAASEAKNWGGEVGEGRWYTAECFKRPYFSIPDAEFIAACEPGAVLALIAENDRLLKLLERTVEQHVPLTELEGVPGWSRVVELVEVVAERDQLKAENKRITEDASSRALRSLRGDCQDLMVEREELKAEIAGLRTGYEAYEQVNAELKAEVEALRDDLEQKHYDANAWRNGEESVWIEVFHSEGDDPFISAISGQITVEQLALIQAEILEYREDYFEKGSGLYVFRCAHCQAHYDNVGMTEPAHWETDFESFSPFPWEEEAAALGQGEQS